MEVHAFVSTCQHWTFVAINAQLNLSMANRLEQLNRGVRVPQSTANPEHDILREGTLRMPEYDLAG
jgi:hypothetical protein